MADAPLDRIPLFVRGGSIVPRQDVDGGVQLEVYPGHDGEFTLYLDSGDGYDYEKGIYAQIPMEWKDCAGELILGKALGAGTAEFLPLRLRIGQDTVVYKGDTIIYRRT